MDEDSNSIMSKSILNSDGEEDPMNVKHIVTKLDDGE
jgi:hypothetical protein